MSVRVAREAGLDPAGADFYMYGHWWACEPCWKVLLEAQVRDVYLLENAHEIFSRERVYAQSLTPSLTQVGLSGVEPALAALLVPHLAEIGCALVEPAQVQVRRTPEGVDIVVSGETDPVYRITHPDPQGIARRIKQVLRQL
jgi:hypothetical protein